MLLLLLSSSFITAANVHVDQPEWAEKTGGFGRRWRRGHDYHIVSGHIPPPFLCAVLAEKTDRLLNSSPLCYFYFCLAGRPAAFSWPQGPE